MRDTSISHVTRSGSFLMLSSSRSGYTVIELVAAMAAFLIVMTAVITGVLTVMRSDMRQQLETERIVEAHRVATTLRSTMRLTRLSEMVRYPAEGPHSAISYPLPVRPGDANLDELDAQGFAVWGETLVLHAWPPNDPSELRLTRFYPRDNSLSLSQRYDQLERVALDGNGNQAANGANSETMTLARMRPEFTLRTDGRTYDFYASSEMLDRSANMGGVRLVPGPNPIRFSVVGKASASSGHSFTIDQLRISPAGLPIEAEALLPATQQSGATAVIEERPLGNWSDRRALSFPAAAPGAVLDLSFFNDTWHETRFTGAGTEFDNLIAFINQVPGAVGTRLRAEGRELAWSAMFQTGTGGASDPLDSYQGAAVRVIVRGGFAEHGPHILIDGDGCTVTFRASSAADANFNILHAFISEVSDHDNPGPDIDQNTVTRIRFGSPSSPQDSVLIEAGQSVRSIPIDFPIDREKSYAISFLVAESSGATLGSPWVWPLNEVGRADTYMLPPFPGIGEGIARTGGWSNRPDLQEIAAVVGVQEIRTTFVDEGVYTSRIIDTGLSSPDYQTLTWGGNFPHDSSVAFRVRTGAEADLSDATEWSDVTSITSQGNISPGAGRYVQVQARLLRDVIHDASPELSHFTLRWLGEETNVGFGGAFHRSPDGGYVEVLVNDEPPASSFRAELGLVLRGKDTSAEESWVFGIETTPRN